MSDATSDRGRLRWRCRRGMKELDVLLTRWLDAHHAEAPSASAARFVTPRRACCPPPRSAAGRPPLPPNAPPPRPSTNITEPDSASAPSSGTPLLCDDDVWLSCAGAPSSPNAAN